METFAISTLPRTLKVVGPFCLVSMPREVKDPTQGLNVQPVVDSTTLPGQYTKFIKIVPGLHFLNVLFFYK